MALPTTFTQLAHGVKVVYKAITMDNLRLLSNSKRMQRDRATLTV